MPTPCPQEVEAFKVHVASLTSVETCPSCRQPLYVGRDGITEHADGYVSCFGRLGEIAASDHDWPDIHSVPQREPIVHRTPAQILTEQFQADRAKQQALAPYLKTNPDGSVRNCPDNAAVIAVYDLGFAAGKGGAR